MAERTPYGTTWKTRTSRRNLTNLVHFSGHNRDLCILTSSSSLYSRVIQSQFLHFSPGTLLHMEITYAYGWEYLSQTQLRVRMSHGPGRRLCKILTAGAIFTRRDSRTTLHPRCQIYLIKFLDNYIIHTNKSCGSK